VGSNRSNLAVIPPGGSHACRASRSPSGLNTRATGASMTREARSVRGVARMLGADTASTKGAPYRRIWTHRRVPRGTFRGVEASRIR
jgi:hypothetical protein